MLPRRPKFDYVADLLDEIALEGLDGITVSSLFERLKFRVNFIIDVESCKEFIWKILIKLTDVKFFCLPEPREELTEHLLSCFTPIDRTVLSSFEEKLYPIHPVSNPLDSGSCADYETRRDVTNEIRLLNLQDFLREWGSRVVVVACLKRRLMALGISHSDVSPDLESLFPNRVDYIYLERVGRARARGVACSGPGSLLAIGKDSKRVFYHIKRLLQLGLVEKYEDSSTSSGLLRVILVRFRMYRVAEDEVDNLSRLIVRELNRRPLKMMPYADVRPFAPNMNAKRLNKLFQSSQFRQRFSVLKSVPYSEVFPNASQEEMKRKSGDEKMIKCIKLIEAVPAKLMKDDGMDGDMDEESMVETVYENREFLYNMPLMTQVYREILAAGSRGLSNVELLKKMDATCPTMKAVMKRLMKDKLIEFKFHQIGRTRTRMFVTSKSEIQKSVVQQLQRLLMENSPENNEAMQIVDLEAEFQSVPALKDVANDPRKMQRIAIVLKTIKAQKIIQAPALQAIIREDEERRSLKDKMDRRSLNRILVQLMQENLVKLIVKRSDNGADIKFYADPTFNDDTDHEDILINHVEDPATLISSIVTETDLEMSAWQKNMDESEPVAKILNSQNMYAPKFLRLSVLHDLVYYMVREYMGITSCEGNDLVAKLGESFPIDEELRNEMPPLYNSHISCYMFIPPLSPIHERIPGWCTVGDVILNCPLSLYTKLVKLKAANGRLQEYLDHPIRCNYTLRSLPPDVRSGLASNRQLGHLTQDIRRLCYMGLVKFGHKCHKRNLYLETFHVNLYASIYDTTNSRSGYFKIDPDESYPVIPYTFQSKQDVKAYWVKLFNVCLETKLGSKSEAELDQDKHQVREERKEVLIESLKPVTFAEALEQDVGALPGDRLGAGGIDSCLFSFLRSNWVGSPAVNESNKTNTPLKRTITTEHLTRKRRKRTTTPKKRVFHLDEFDLQATQTMRTLRVQWSKDEDNVCLIIKAALGYLCPNFRQSARVPWADMREALWRHVPTANDKTQLAVRRRIQFLVKKLGKGPLIASLTQVLRKTPEVGAQFDCSEAVSQLKPSAPNAKELHDLLRCTFHQLVDFMVERFIDNGHIVNLQELQLPDSMEELGEIYNLQEPPRDDLTMDRVKEDSIKAVLLSSMMSSNDKSSLATQLFEIYRQYDESILQAAYKKLHREKVITLKKRNQPSQVVSANYLPMRNSPYYFSHGFCFLMNSKYRQTVYHDAYLELNQLLCNGPGNSIELNLHSCGPAAFVLASLGHVDLTASTPEQFVVIDTQLIPQQVSTRIMDRYSELVKLSEPDAKPTKRLLDEDDDVGDDDDFDDEPPVKRQLVCTEPNVADNAATRVAKAVKHRAGETEPSEQNFGFRNARLALFTLREVASKEMESQITKNPVDLFVVSTSKVVCTTSGTLSQFGIPDGKNVKKILGKLTSRSDALRVPLDEVAVIDRVSSSSQTVGRDDLTSILTFIDGRAALGASVQDLLYYCEQDQLRDAVHLLEGAGLLCRVGVDETRFVSQKHISAWTVQSFKLTRLNREKVKPSDLSQPGVSSATAAVVEHSAAIEIIMRPWLRIDGSVNRRVVDKLLGTILGHIMMYPGISVVAVTDQFKSGLSPVWTKEIIELLVDLGCITRFIVHRQKASLFSKGFTRISDGYTGFKADDEILLEASIDAVIKLGMFIGNKSYSKDVLEVPTTKKSTASPQK